MATDEKTGLDDQDVDAAIRKVQKLLSRTGKGKVSDEEADTAMRIAQEIMSKYNLDMATVEARGSGPEDVGSVRVDERSSARARFKWQQQLMAYVAEANFCLHVVRYERKTDGEGDIVWGTDGRRVRVPVHRVIGRKANVITTQLMFDYLCQAVEQSVPVTARSERFSRASSSWKAGCADRLCERLAKRREDLMKEHDAKVKEQEAAHAADLERRRQEAKGKAERTLGPRPATPEEIADGLRFEAWVATGMKSPAPEDPDRPEVDKADGWKPGDTAEPEPEVVPPSTALVLSSVYDEREQDLNEDLRWGWEPGTTSKRKAKEREEERLEAEAEAKHAAENLEAEEPEIVETPRQKAARERREAAEYEKDRARWAREDARDRRRELKEHMKRDHNAYRGGAEAGKKIGLDPQVQARKDQKRLGK